MGFPPARTTAERVRDVLGRLRGDVDLWVATASAGGEPHLIPLSFLWHDGVIVLATSSDSATVRNLRRDGASLVRLALGETRDVVLVEGTVRFLAGGDLDPAVGHAYAAHAGWDPQRGLGNVFLLVTPVRVRAWREENELAGRTVMRDGVWLA